MFGRYSVYDDGECRMEYEQSGDKDVVFNNILKTIKRVKNE